MKQLLLNDGPEQVMDSSNRLQSSVEREKGGRKEGFFFFPPVKSSEMESLQNVRLWILPQMELSVEIICSHEVNLHERCT